MPRFKPVTHKLIDYEGKTVYTGTFESCSNHFLSDECELVPLNKAEADEANNWLLP